MSNFKDFLKKNILTIFIVLVVIIVGLLIALSIFIKKWIWKKKENREKENDHSIQDYEEEYKKLMEEYEKLIEENQNLMQENEKIYKNHENTFKVKLRNDIKLKDEEIAALKQQLENLRVMHRYVTENYWKELTKVRDTINENYDIIENKEIKYTNQIKHLESEVINFQREVEDLKAKLLQGRGDEFEIIDSLVESGGPSSATLQPNSDLEVIDISREQIEVDNFSTQPTD